MSTLPRKKRIVLIDDQKAITALWRVLLEKTGTYVVREENSSRRALEAARDFAPDLIVLDLNMPELDGCEVARAISTDQHLYNTPILFMTSLVTEDEALSGKSIDGFPCIAKPTTINNLIGQIEKHISLGRRSGAQMPVVLAA